MNKKEITLALNHLKESLKPGERRTITEALEFIDDQEVIIGGHNQINDYVKKEIDIVLSDIDYKGWEKARFKEIRAVFGD